MDVLRVGRVGVVERVSSGWMDGWMDVFEEWV